MNTSAIVPIVEGQGEVDAVVGLLSRLLPEDEIYVHKHQPIRKPRDLLLKPHGIKFVLDRAMALRPRPTGILLMIDADDDCPVALGEHMRSLAKEIRPDAPVFTVIPNREFEAWFLASASSFAGLFDLPNDLETPKNPESIRDAKGWFTKRMPPGIKYRESFHQKRFVKHLDLEVARANSRSFRKLCFDLKLMIGPPHSS